ncbi:ABC transporter, ATP-binding protein [Giardia duodenalis ATCC 50581]|uniref:ABC transporter, ATP-binding protein n=1 Tax=Giardia intestinalis (strain ATCC 50581 / GS clone H7) TaxID=598745 RepID=C6M0H4_GIAIB|nr:ABC transporter, ATP-binding protein [Giardia intestinalis ATCC 50581]
MSFPRFVLHTYKTRIGTVISLVIAPVLTFLLLWGIFYSRLDYPLLPGKGVKYSVPTLPPCSELTGCTDDTVYLAYGPRTTTTYKIINSIVKSQKITGKVLPYDNADDMEHDITAVGLSGPNLDKFTAEWFEAEVRGTIENCTESFKKQLTTDPIFTKDTVDKLMNDSYGLTPTALGERAKGLAGRSYFLAIRFNVPDTFDGKSNISYTIFYNQSMVGSLAYGAHDRLVRKVSNSWTMKTWTSLGYTVQQMVDSSIAKVLLGKDISYDLSPLPDRVDTTVPVFHKSYIYYTVPMTTLIVLSAMLGTIFRGPFHSGLRRLGVSEFKVLLSNYLSLLILDFVSSFLLFYAMYFSNQYPLAAFDGWLPLVLSILTSLSISVFTVFLTYLVYTPAFSLILSTIVALSSTLVPAVVLMTLTGLLGMFSPALVPPPITWIFTVLAPYLTNFALFDNLLVIAKYGDELVYNKKLYPTIPISFITTNYDDYYTTERKQFGATKTYRIPAMWILVLISLIQSLIVFPLICIFLSYAKPEEAWRGLPWNFLCSRKFYHRKKLDLTKVSSVRMEMTDLEKTYKTHKKCSIKATENHVLQKLTLSSQENSVLGLIAPSAGGKSTTLKIIAGELAMNNSGGSCIVLGEFDMSNKYDAYHIRPYVGYCPQDRTNVWMGLSVWENVMYSVIFRAESIGTMDRVLSKYKTLDEYVLSTLNKIGLGSTTVHKRAAKDLSGGMLRRLALANATVSYPPIYLLDEVTLGVDPVLKRDIWSYIHGLVEESGSSVILTTHDADEVGELANNIVIVKDGKVMTSNSPLGLRSDLGDYGIILTITNNAQLESCGCNRRMLIEECLESLKKSVWPAGDIDPALQPYVAKDLEHVVRITLPLHAKITPAVICEIADMLQAMAIRYRIDYAIEKASLDDIFTKLVDDSCSMDMDNAFVDSAYGGSVKVRPSQLRWLLHKNLLIDLKEYFISFIVIFLLILCLCLVVINGISAAKKTILKENLELLTTAKAGYFEACFTPCVLTQKLTNIPTFSFNKAIATCMNRTTNMLFNAPYQTINQMSPCVNYLKYAGLDSWGSDEIQLGDGSYTLPLGNKDAQYAGRTFYGVVTGGKLESWLGSLVDGSSSPIWSEIVTNETGLKLAQKYLQSQYTLVPLDNANWTSVFTAKDQTENLVNPLNDKSNIFAFMMPRQSITTLPLKCLRGGCASTDKNNTVYIENQLIFSQDLRDMLKHVRSAQSTVIPMTKEEFDDPLTRVTKVKQAFQSLKAGIFDVSSTNPDTLKFTYYTQFPPFGTQNWTFIKGFANISLPNGTKVAYPMPGFPTNLETNPSNVFPFYLPTRPHPTLSIYTLDPLVKLTGALFRRAMASTATSAEFYKSIYNFTYSARIKPMPYYSEARFLADSKKIGNTIALDVSANYLLPFVVIVPMTIISARVAREYESRVVRLYVLHNVPKVKLILSHLIYYTAWSFIPVLIAMLLVSANFPELLWEKSVGNIFLLLAMYLLASASSSIFAIIIGVFTKTVRTSILISFMFVVITVITHATFEMNEVLTIVFSLLLPALNALYQIRRAIVYDYTTPVGAWLCPVVFIVHLSVALIVVYFLDAGRKRHTCKKEVVPHTEPKIHPVHQERHTETSDIMSQELSRAVTNLDFEAEEVKPHLSVQHVTHRYPDGYYAVKDVSFEVRRNEVFALLGANGAGKSTIMNALTGIHVPTEGKAMCIKNDQNTTRQNILSTSVRQGEYLTVVPQDDILWPEFTPLEHLRLMVGFTCKNLKPNIKDIETVLRVTSLYDDRNRKVSQLSGGSQRRLTLAMVIVSSPSLVCLDEITTGLSSRMKNDIWKAILASRSVCRTMMLTTHDMPEVEALADRCCIMKLGKVIAEGTIADICRLSKVQFTLICSTALLEGSNNESRQRFEELRKQFVAHPDVSKFLVRSIDDTRAGEVRFEFKNKGALSDVLRAADSLGLLANEWSIDVSRLENSFMQIINE